MIFSLFRPRRRKAASRPGAYRPRVESLEARDVPATVFHLDLGTALSPPAAGYTEVAPRAYSGAVGYGWQATSDLSAQHYTRPYKASTADPLRADVHEARSGTFAVDLPDGAYNVTVTLGHPTEARDAVSVYGEGRLLASGLSTQAGQALRRTFRVSVGDGQLSLRLVDTGGSTPRFALAALDILPARAVRVPRGVHALFGYNKPVDPAVLAMADVDGVALRTSWDDIETADGVYDWSYLDAAVGAAAAAGKQVSFTVAAGTHTPEWVYAAGARAFPFVKDGQALKIPVPWDPVFLREWTAFVAALGARYAKNPAVALVKITGINTTTGETMLPATPADTANWQAIGYTRARLEGAWVTIADAFYRAFPNSKLAYTQMPMHVPPIDAEGNLMTDNTADWVFSYNVMSLGLSRYGKHFAAFNTALRATHVSPQVAAVDGQATTGYQTLWWATGDTTYRLNGGTPISEYDALLNTVKKGLNAGAEFLELYAIDILNPALAGVIAYAHDRMT